MGNSVNTNMSQHIPAALIQKSAGTWTPTLASNVLSDNRTAADATFNLFIPIMIPGNAKALQGARLKSIEVLYTVGTAAMDSVAAPELEKISVSSPGAVTGAAVTTTQDTGHDAAAERITVADHRMVISVTTPEWVDNDVYYNLYIACDAAATSVFKLYGAIANFDLKV